MMPETQQRQPNGGLKLDSHKTISRHEDIVSCAQSERYIIPLQQHIGEAAEPIVSVGEKVLKGQMIAQPSAMISAAAHSPVSGKSSISVSTIHRILQL